MATTAVFAEIIVVGLQAEAWLVLLVLLVAGLPSWETGTLSSWAALVTFAVVALSYVLGIVVDRLADSAYRLFRQGTPAVGPMQLRVRHESEQLAKFLDYQRSRWRIARGTVLNLAVGTPIAVLFAVVRTDWSSGQVVALAVGLVVALAASALAGREISRAWMKRLGEAYAMVAPPSDAAAPSVVAAVCWRDGTAGPEVLVVQAGDDRWTFPKGKVDAARDVAALSAVRRELAEEAGVVGEPDLAPLRSYRFWKGGRKEQQVTAYAVRAGGGRGETGRAPRWVPLADAYDLLGRGHPPEGAHQHAVVLEALERRLDPRT